MKHRYHFWLLLAAGLLLAGCGGPVGREQADRLSEWLGKQPYSVWSTFRDREGDPERPPSPDGLTLGSPNIFAAVGCDPDDLSEIDSLWGDTRSARAFAKSVTVSIATSAEPDRPLGKFARQTLRRVRHTAIAVFEGEDKGLHVRAVDFAPMDPQDNFLVRWFLVENQGQDTPRVTLSLHLNGNGDWKSRSHHAYQLGEKLGIVSDQNLQTSEGILSIPMGRVAPGRRAAAALFLVVAHDEATRDAGMARAEAQRENALDLLERTKTNWTEWCAKAPLDTGDERTDDLLDSLLCLLRAHVGPAAIHTGSVRYPHDRAWVRDDYWAQLALLQLGYVQEAKTGLDFFHRAWQQSGLASSYRIPDRKPMPYGYARVEFPHYFVLMVRDAETLGRVDAKQYWDMVRGCLDQVSVPQSGLQPMNGDETWLLAAPVRELDDLLDNSWLLIASAEFGSKLALRMGDHGRAARYGSMAYRARLALRSFMPTSGAADWFATGRGSDGSLDMSLCPQVYARGAMLGVLPATDAQITSGLVASWERLKYERGLRTYSRSTTIDGGNPGYVLYAMADNPGCDSLFRRDLLARVQRFASATGCVWEFHDLHDPAWGGEKRRLWDSAVVLSGLVHALFDVQHGTSTFFVPKPDPIELSLPPEDTPGFNADELLTSSEGLVIFQQNSPEHAAHLARELLRQLNRPLPVEVYSGTPPEDGPALIVSPADPPVGWLQVPAGYYTRAWGGPPQLWVKNQGSVFADTEPLLLDLCSYLPPQRDKPLPYPDQNYDLIKRYGEPPSGQAIVEAYWSGPAVTRPLDLAGGQAKLHLGRTEVSVTANADRSKPGVLLLQCSALRPDPVEVSVTLPAGWWLVCARDVSGQWDRVADPVREDDLPDGRVRITYSLRASSDHFAASFDLAKLRVVTR